jgi:NAD dependent epimerase/dehydratase
MNADTLRDLSGIKVAVTGADGFIGSHLVEELVRRGASVRALAQYNSMDSHGWLDDLAAPVRDSIELVRGDIRDSSQMISVCQDRQFVFHLAALISIPFSYDAPGAYIQTNVQGTANVLDAALRGGAEKVVHTSTSEVYGTAITAPISEDHPLQGQSPYSASKIGADMMATAYHGAFDCPVVTLRPFNTYGPRQSERAVLPTIVRQVIDDNCGEITLGDLSPKRDFCFVGDTVAAFLAVASTGPEANGTVLNAGTGRMVTIGDAVKAVRDITGSDKPVAEEAQRLRPAKSEVMALQADYSKLQDLTGWAPQHTLEQGLARVVEWWRARDGNWRRDAGYIY